MLTVGSSRGNEYNGVSLKRRHSCLRAVLTHVQDPVRTAAGRSLHQLGDGERQFLFEKDTQNDCRGRVPSFKKQSGDDVRGPYSQPFVVLSSQRVKAAIVWVGQEGRSVENNDQQCLSRVKGGDTKGNRKDKDNHMPPTLSFVSRDRCSR